MGKEKQFIHPYIPNSVPEIKEEMLKEIGIKDVETLYQEIPDRLRFKRELNLPQPFLSEYELRKHVKSILRKNKTCDEYLNFLGAGCWQHYVPAVCDEINGRSEFLTAYAGEYYSDIGKWQAFFEFQSMMAELVKMDVVNVPTYSWGAAAGDAIRMASRITGRYEVLIPRIVSPERLDVIRNLCRPEIMAEHINIKLVNYNKDTGMLDVNDLKEKISNKTAAVYIENPSYLGFIESQGEKVSNIAHEKGAVSIVGVDPISLGVVATPSDYGADIVVGSCQPLGIHMNCGGGTIGFIATRDEEEYVGEIPSWLVSITETAVEGEYGFGPSFFERTSYVGREKGKDWAGTTVALWTITAGVYMALMGPQGFKEIGETIIKKTHYAIHVLSKIKGVKILFPSYAFKEFVVNFNGTEKTVQDINKALLDKKIFGGKDISNDFSEFGNSALYCITEIHSKDDIDRLADSLKEVIK